MDLFMENDFESLELMHYNQMNKVSEQLENDLFTVDDCMTLNAKSLKQMTLNTKSMKQKLKSDYGKKRRLRNSHKFVECSVCFKHLKESSLGQHMKTHIGLKPYECDICHSRFTRRGDVVRHKITLHKSLDVNGALYDVQTECDTKHLLLNEGNVEKLDDSDVLKKPENCMKMTNEWEDYLEPSLASLWDEKKSNNVYIKPKEKHVKNNIFIKNNKVSDGKKCNIMPINIKPLSIRHKSASDFNLSSSDYNDGVNHAIATAVSLSQNIISSLQKTNVNTSAKSRHSSRSKGTKIQIKANIDGKVQTFTVNVPDTVNFDVQTNDGLILASNIVSRICSQKGQIEGNINVKITKHFNQD